MTQPGDSYSRDRALADLRAIDERQGGPRYRRVQEDDHVEADEILLRLIDDDAITEIFHRIGKWYA